MFTNVLSLPEICVSDRDVGTGRGIWDICTPTFINIEKVSIKLYIYII